MLNWLKKIFAKLKGAKPIVGDVGLVNVKPEFNADIKGELKFADKQENKLVEVNNIDNSQQMTQQNFYIGMSYNDIVNIVQREQIIANNNLMSKIEPRLLPENIDKIKNDFDFIDTYREAVKISAKRKDEITDDMLADIISERIKETDDFRKIILNETINTIGKLTQSQIEILEIISLCHYTKFDADTFDNLINKIENTIKPMICKDYANIDFEYLAYTGCIESSLSGSYDFYKIIRHIVSDKYDIEVYRINENYKQMEAKWKKSFLCHSKPTAIGKLIGLKYYNILNNNEISNIERIYQKEE